MGSSSVPPINEWGNHSCASSGPAAEYLHGALQPRPCCACPEKKNNMCSGQASKGEPWSRACGGHAGGHVRLLYPARFWWRRVGPGFVLERVWLVAERFLQLCAKPPGCCSASPAALPFFSWLWTCRHPSPLATLRLAAYCMEMLVFLCRTARIRFFFSL